MVRFINGSLYTNHPPALMMTKTPLSRCRLPLGRLRFVPEVYGLQLFFVPFLRGRAVSRRRGRMSRGQLAACQERTKGAVGRGPWTVNRVYGDRIKYPVHVTCVCPRDTYKKNPPPASRLPPLSSLVGGSRPERAGQHAERETEEKKDTRRRGGKVVEGAWTSNPVQRPLIFPT